MISILLERERAMAARLLSSGFRPSTLPDYIQPESMRPCLSEVYDGKDLPVINLACSDRTQILQEINHACEQFGFFQVINHGVEEGLMEKMVGVSREFFELPVEEKMKLYSGDTSKRIRLWTSSDIKVEKTRNWRDYLRLRCYPVRINDHEYPSNPPLFRETVQSYSREVMELGSRLHELISESLGLDKDCIKKAFGEQQLLMSINYYPPCPRPELTYGLPGHADPNLITILLQDATVEHGGGLQVRIDGVWISVKPLPGAFVVNIGDVLQALSNGRYKSAWHRAITNPNKPRLSIASFVAPHDDATISPLEPLLKHGSKPLYKAYVYAELSKSFSNHLNQEHCLDHFKNN